MARTGELDDGDVVAFRHGLGLIAGDQAACISNRLPAMIVCGTPSGSHASAEPSR